MKLIFETNEQEKKEILERHNLIKKALQSKVGQVIINEQATTPTGVELLKLARDKKCKIAVGGVIQSAPGKPSVLYKVADYDSANGYFKKGDELYIKDDYTFDVVTTDSTGNKKLSVTGKKWACSALTAEADAAKKETEAAATKAKQDIEASTKKNLELTKTEGSWKERKDINDTDANVENPQMYEKKVVNGVTLYRSKALSGISSGLTEDQKSIIKSWQDKGYKVRTDLTPEEAKTWKEVVVSPATDGYFSQDLKMFFDPTTLTKGVGTGDTKVSVTTVIQNAVASRVPTDKKDCKQTIEAYYISYKKKRPLEPNEFDALKTKTQACKNEFYGDWGAVFSGGNKADEILDVMSGVKPGGPSTYGTDSKWRLQ
jgi:hypothetical protein